MDLFEQTNDRKYIFTVSELTNEIKILLETNLPSLWVQGEISNFTHHRSGHMYFSLKDEDAQIACVMWRNRNLGLFFTPQDGMKVLVYGSIRVYEKRGNYQIDVIKMVPAGIGELQMAFEQLKAKLREEGLFDEQYKKPIPSFPERIGIITSQTGAAIRDIINVLTRRFPSAQLILRPVKVQGDGAAQEIADAIDEMNEYGQVDVLIVGRGGGSLEDLWAFNEEIVARAIFRSHIPIISAVGHEVDFTIADFVADMRAPTPSAASELVAPDRAEVLRHISAQLDRMHNALQRKINAYRDQLEHLSVSYGFRRPLDIVLQYQQRLDELAHVAAMAVNHRLSFEKSRLSHLERRLMSLAPESILKRGYSICWRQSDKKILRSAQEVNAGENVGVQFYKGGIEAKVLTVDPRQTINGIGSFKTKERH